MQFDDVGGVPLAFGQAYFTLAGGTTPVAVYQDDAFAVPHASPVVANAQGIFPRIYVNPALGKVRVRIISATGSLAAPLIDADPANSTFSLNGVTNAYLAQAPASTLKGNLTAAAATPTDVTSDQVTNFLRYATTAAPGAVQLAPAGDITSAVLAATPASVAAQLAGAIAPIAQLLAQNGYMTFSNGLIVQWGRVGPVAIDDFSQIVFPIPFPTACYNVQHSPSAASPYTVRQDSWSLRQDAPTLVGVKIYCASSANTQAITIDWFAVGK